MPLANRFLLLLAVFLSAGPLRADDSATVTLSLPKLPPYTLKVDGKEIKTGASNDVTIEVKDIPTGKSKTVKIELVLNIRGYHMVITRKREVEVKGGDKRKLPGDIWKDDPKLDTIVFTGPTNATPDDIIDEMYKLAKVTKDDVIYIPNVGYGDEMTRAIKGFGAKKCIGIAPNEECARIAKKRVTETGAIEKIVIHQAAINEKNLTELEQASVVFLYLPDEIGARLEPILREKLKPGSCVVSHRFYVGNWKPDTTKIVTSAGDRYTLHLWTVPEPKKK